MAQFKSYICNIQQGGYPYPIPNRDDTIESDVAAKKDDATKIANGEAESEEKWIRLGSILRNGDLRITFTDEVENASSDNQCKGNEFYGQKYPQINSDTSNSCVANANDDNYDNTTDFTNKGMNSIQDYIFTHIDKHQYNPDKSYDIEYINKWLLNTATKEIVKSNKTDDDGQIFYCNKQVLYERYYSEGNSDKEIKIAFDNWKSISDWENFHFAVINKTTKKINESEQIVNRTPPHYGEEMIRDSSLRISSAPKKISDNIKESFDKRYSIQIEIRRGEGKKETVLKKFVLNSKKNPINYEIDGNTKNKCTLIIPNCYYDSDATVWVKIKNLEEKKKKIYYPQLECSSIIDGTRTWYRYEKGTKGKTITENSSISETGQHNLKFNVTTSIGEVSKTVRDTAVATAPSQDIYVTRYSVDKDGNISSYRDLAIAKNSYFDTATATATATIPSFNVTSTGNVTGNIIVGDDPFQGAGLDTITRYKTKFSYNCQWFENENINLGFTRTLTIETDIEDHYESNKGVTGTSIKATKKNRGYNDYQIKDRTVYHDPGTISFKNGGRYIFEDNPDEVEDGETDSIISREDVKDVYGCLFADQIKQYKIDIQSPGWYTLSVTGDVKDNEENKKGVKTTDIAIGHNFDQTKSQHDKGVDRYTWTTGGEKDYLLAKGTYFIRIAMHQPKNVFSKYLKYKLKFQRKETTYQLAGVKGTDKDYYTFGGATSPTILYNFYDDLTYYYKLEPPSGNDDTKEKGVQSNIVQINFESNYEENLTFTAYVIDNDDNILDRLHPIDDTENCYIFSGEPILLGVQPNLYKDENNVTINENNKLTDSITLKGTNSTTVTLSGDYYEFNDWLTMANTKTITFNKDDGKTQTKYIYIKPDVNGAYSLIESGHKSKQKKSDEYKANKFTPNNNYLKYKINGLNNEGLYTGRYLPLKVNGSDAGYARQILSVYKTNGDAFQFIPFGPDDAGYLKVTFNAKQYFKDNADQTTLSLKYNLNPRKDNLLDYSLELIDNKEGQLGDKNKVFGYTIKKINKINPGLVDTDEAEVPISDNSPSYKPKLYTNLRHDIANSDDNENIYKKITSGIYNFAQITLPSEIKAPNYYDIVPYYLNEEEEKDEKEEKYYRLFYMNGTTDENIKDDKDRYCILNSNGTEVSREDGYYLEPNKKYYIGVKKREEKYYYNYQTPLEENIVIDGLTVGVDDDFQNAYIKETSINNDPFLYGIKLIFLLHEDGENEDIPISLDDEWKDNSLIEINLSEEEYEPNVYFNGAGEPISDDGTPDVYYNKVAESVGCSYKLLETAETPYYLKDLRNNIFEELPYNDSQREVKYVSYNNNILTIEISEVELVENIYEENNVENKEQYKTYTYDLSGIDNKNSIGGYYNTDLYKYVYKENVGEYVPGESFIKIEDEDPDISYDFQEKTSNSNEDPDISDDSQEETSNSNEDPIEKGDFKDVKEELNNDKYIIATDNGYSENIKYFASTKLETIFSLTEEGEEKTSPSTVYSFTPRVSGIYNISLKYHEENGVTTEKNTDIKAKISLASEDDNTSSGSLLIEKLTEDTNYLLLDNIELQRNQTYLLSLQYDEESFNDVEEIKLDFSVSLIKDNSIENDKTFVLNGSIDISNMKNANILLDSYYEFYYGNKENSNANTDNEIIDDEDEDSYYNIFPEDQIFTFNISNSYYDNDDTSSEQTDDEDMVIEEDLELLNLPLYDVYIYTEELELLEVLEDITDNFSLSMSVDDAYIIYITTAEESVDTQDNGNASKILRNSDATKNEITIAAIESDPENEDEDEDLVLTGESDETIEKNISIKQIYLGENEIISSKYYTFTPKDNFSYTFNFSFKDNKEKYNTVIELYDSLEGDAAIYTYDAGFQQLKEAEKFIEASNGKDSYNVKYSITYNVDYSVTALNYVQNKHYCINENGAYTLCNDKKFDANKTYYTSPNCQISNKGNYILNNIPQLEKSLINSNNYYLKISILKYNSKININNYEKSKYYYYDGDTFVLDENSFDSDRAYYETVADEHDLILNVNRKDQNFNTLKTKASWAIPTVSLDGTLTPCEMYIKDLTNMCVYASRIKKIDLADPKDLSKKIFYYKDENNKKQGQFNKNKINYNYSYYSDADYTKEVTFYYPGLYYKKNGDSYIIATSNNKENVQYYELQLLWTQPLLILQDEYSSEILNTWNGETIINEEDGIIATTTINAGVKDANNKYSGIILGETRDVPNNSRYGLFGYSSGSQSFGFASDGSAFIGQSGYGRIEFKGNSGIIESSHYSDGGMSIDVNEGKINIQGSKQDNGGRTKITLSPKAPFFTITNESNKVLFKISNKTNFIQTANFDKNKKTGVCFNLGEGTLTAYNFKLSASSPLGGGFELSSERSKKSQKITYFKVYNAGGKNLFKISDSEIVLQSGNYTSANGEYNGFNLTINEKGGNITAHDFCLKAVDDGNHSITIDSNAPNYPLEIGGNFKVKWDGTVDMKGFNMNYHKGYSTFSNDSDNFDKDFVVYYGNNIPEEKVADIKARWRLRVGRIFGVPADKKNSYVAISNLHTKKINSSSITLKKDTNSTSITPGKIVLKIDETGTKKDYQLILNNSNISLKNGNNKELFSVDNKGRLKAISIKTDELEVNNSSMKLGGQKIYVGKIQVPSSVVSTTTKDKKGKIDGVNTKFGDSKTYKVLFVG